MPTINRLATALRHIDHDRGQSTAEYALVLLGAATVAVIFMVWAGGTDTITRLFDAVMDSVIDKVQ